MKERRWQYTAPDDILSHISDFLPLEDWINFRGVCRSWREVPSCRSNITEFSKEDRWCIFYDFDARDKDMCYLYQEGNTRSCSVRLPNLRGATCLMSSFGWLLIRRNNDYILFNPFTLAEILLPQYPAQPIESTACQMGTFTAVPTSTNCIVILVSSRDSSTLEVSWCYLAEKQWTVDRVCIGDGVIALENILNQIPGFLLFSPCLCGGNYDSACRILSSVYMRLRNRVMLRGFVEELQTGKQNKIRYVDWHSKLRDVHLDNWLCRFGREFVISFCPFNECKKDSFTAFGGRYWIVHDRNALTVNASSVVKAAWIQPIFPEYLAPGSKHPVWTLSVQNYVVYLHFFILFDGCNLLLMMFKNMDT